MIDIVKYLKNVINNLDSSSDLYGIAKSINENLVNQYGYTKNADREEKLYYILLYCQKNDIEENASVDLITNVDNIETTSTTTNNAIDSKENQTNSNSNTSASQSSGSAERSYSQSGNNTQKETSRQKSYVEKKEPETSRVSDDKQTTDGKDESQSTETSKEKVETKKQEPETPSTADEKDESHTADSKDESQSTETSKEKVETEKQEPDISSATDENTGASKVETTPAKNGGDTSTTYTKTSASTKNSTPIVDVDTEVIHQVSDDYGDVKSTLGNTKISITNSIVKKYAGDITSLVNSGNDDINGDLNNAKNVMIESVSSIEYVDDQIESADIKNFDFNDIWKYTGKIISTGVKVADKEFFEQCGYTVDKNIVIVGDYKYNVKNHTFSINGKSIGNVYFYIPTGVSDYSKLNTLTMLSHVDSYGIERKRDVGAASNSIIVAFDKADSSALKVPSNIAGTTKFINQVAKTDLSKCQNIITGGSRFGARSLKIAAETGDLYQTVICVNNAAIVKGVIGGRGRQKEAFDSIEQLQKLNGKNIYFVSSKEDPNLTMYYNGKSETERNNDVTKCYVYTGMELLTKYCPDSQVYFISNNDNPEFANINSPNYVYGRNLWSQVAKSNDYAKHGTLHNLLNDLCSSNLVGYNAYTANSR